MDWMRVFILVLLTCFFLMVMHSLERNNKLVRERNESLLNQLEDK